MRWGDRSAASITGKVARQLMELYQAGIVQAVPIHITTIDQAIYARIHTHPRTLQARIQGYRNLLEAGFPHERVMGIMTILRPAMESLEQTIDWIVDEMGARAICMPGFKFCGFADEHHEWQPTLADMKRAMDYRAQRLGAQWLKIRARFARRGEAIRHRVVARLHLQPGDTVLDVACGTGANFPLIEDAIGKEGRLIGIDLSPDMLARARERIESSGWDNVTLIESAAEEADLPGDADTVLFSFTHDVMRSTRAMENIFRYWKPVGRVVASGMKWAPWWAAPVNIFVCYMACQ